MSDELEDVGWARAGRDSLIRSHPVMNTRILFRARTIYSCEDVDGNCFAASGNLMLQLEGVRPPRLLTSDPNCGFIAPLHFFTETKKFTEYVICTETDIDLAAVDLKLLISDKLTPFLDGFFDLDDVLEHIRSEGSDTPIVISNEHRAAYTAAILVHLGRHEEARAIAQDAVERFAGPRGRRSYIFDEYL